MPVNKMKKAQIIVHNDEYEVFISSLQKLGFFHIDTEKLKEDAKSLPFSYTIPIDEEQVKSYLIKIERIMDYAAKWELKASGIRSNKSFRTFTDQEFQDILDNFNYETIIFSLFDMISRMQNLIDEKTKYKDAIALLHPVSNLTMDLQYLSSTVDCIIKIIAIPSTKYDEALKAAQDISELSETFFLASFENRHYTVFAAHKTVFDDILMVLRKFGAEEYIVHETEGTVANVQKKYTDIISKIDKDIEILDGEIENLFETYQKALEVFYDQLFSEVNRYKVETNFIATEKTRLIMGWIREEDEGKLQKLLEAFSYASYTLEDPQSDEAPPIYLKNKKVNSPYEFLTELYSFPNYNEIDPTPHVAPFFPLIFGICLGDAGYGLVLFFGSLLIMKKLSKESRKLPQILVQSAIWTIIVGVVTGSYFGSRLELLPAYLSSFANRFIIFNPLENPMKLFIIGIFLGIIQIFYSYFISFFENIRIGNAKKSFTEVLAYIVLLASVLTLLMAFFGMNIPSLILNIVQFASIAAALSILIFVGNDAPSGMEVGLNKFFAIYGLVGIMGDILSYARLLALGLSTSVIAMVVNILAELVRGKDPSVVSILMSIVVIVFGHTYNLVLNVLGAFIHSMRLQYVEFFKAFYAGGGKRFTPFRRIHKFSVIVKE